MIWFLGDSTILPAVQAFAGADEVILSASQNATVEEVWTDQITKIRNKRWIPPVVVICYINARDYDSERTVLAISIRVPESTRLIFISYTNDPRVDEGLTHDGKLAITQIRTDDHSVENLTNLLLQVK